MDKEHGDSQFSKYVEELNRVLELLPDAVIGSDLDGNIVFANSLAAKLFGYSPDELLKMQIGELVPESERERHEYERRSSFETKPIRPMHAGLALEGRRSSGELFAADISLSWLRRPDGDIAVTTVRDVSGQRSAAAERARIEAELARSRAKRLESVGKLASDVAKDFNNQLGVILNHAQFLKEALDDQPELMEDAVRIEQAARHSAELTKRLLVFGQRGLRFPKVDDVNRLILDLEDEIRSRIRDEVELQIRLADDIWAASIDESRFRECVLYMIDNAVEAINERGLIRVSTANVELVEDSGDPEQDLPRAPGRYVVLTVSDSGEGMEGEIRERIFEPFFSTKDAGRHPGMGLSTVYGSVKQAGGSLVVHSEPDAGTSVVTYLPAVDWPESSSRADAQTSTTGEEISVLLVDADESLNRLVEQLLIPRGDRLTTCESSDDARALLVDDSRTFDVLLTNLEFPETPGSELAREALGLRPDLAVVHMIGYDETISADQLKRAEGLNLLEKPFTTDALADALTAAIDRR